MKKVFPIKAAKQENGLWGTPKELYAMEDMIVVQDDDIHLLESAIIMALAEQFETPFKIHWHSEKGFFMSFDRPVRPEDDNRKHFFIAYADYKVQGDMLIFEQRPTLKPNII